MFRQGSHVPRRTAAVFVTLALLLPATLLVATSAPRAVAEPNPFAQTDALVLAALAEDQAAAWDAVLDPTWRTTDPAELQAFLERHYDPATDTFSFAGPTAANDAQLARALLDQIHLAEEFARGQQEDLREAFETLFLTGQLPEGWTEVGADGQPLAPADTPAPAPTPESQGPGGEQGPTPEQLAQAPLPAWLEGSPGGPGAMADPADQVHFFISDCPSCDQYLFGGNVISATFDLGPKNITPEKIEEASLDISAFDVDWGNPGCPAGPERDAVQLNGNFVGYLTGADSTWSSSSYNLNPAWFVEGVNTVSVVVDSTGTGCWAVTVDWFDVTVNKPTGPVRITDHRTDKEAYNLAQSVKVDSILETSEEGPYPARIEWNLVQPDGNIVQTKSQSASLQKDTPYPVQTTMTLPNTGPEGVWTVVAIAFDKDGGKSDEDSWPINVGTDLKVEKDDIKLKILESNPQSGTLKVEVTVNWHLSTKITEPQAYQAHLYAESGGQRRSVWQESRNDAAGDFNKVQTVDLKAGSKLEVILDPDNGIKEAKEDNNKAEKSLCNPKVKEATPKIKGSYFEKVELKNEWTAKTEPVEPDCPDIEKVVYDFDGKTVESTAAGEDWKAEYDMGKMSNGWNRPLKVYAVDKDGNKGDPWETKLRIWKMPEFMVYGWKGPIGRQGIDFSLSINGEYATFKFAFNKTIMQGKVNVPTSIPVLGDKIGGEWGGTVEFGVSGEVTTKGDTFKLQGYIKGDGKAGNKAKAGLKGTLSGDFKNPPGDVGWYLSKLTVGLEGSFTSPPIPLYKIVGFEVTFTISISINGNFVFSENGSPKLFGLGWDHFNFSIRIGLGIRALLGDEKVVGLSAGLEGGVKPTFLIPPPKFLRDVVFDVKFEVKGHFLGWEKKVFGVSWEATYVASGPTQFELPERAWVGEGYAAFVATGPDGDVVDRMYPWSNPETASNALGHMMTVYTHDVPGKSRPGAYDAYFTYFDGTAWSNPAAIANADYPDFDPAVALDGTGQALAVWMRFEDTTLGETDILPEHVDIVDLYYSHWTAATGWSAPQALTDDGIVQLLQSAAPDGAGGFLVAWASDPSNEVLTASQLDMVDGAPVVLPTRDLHLSRVAPGVPPTPAVTLATDVALVGMPRAAPLPGGAVLYAWAEDGDGDARTRDDVTLHSRVTTVAGALGEPAVVAQGTVKAPVFEQGAALPTLAWVTETPDAEPQVVVERAVTQVVPGLTLPAVTLGEERTLLPANELYPIINDLRVQVDATTADRVVTWTGASADGEGQQVFSAVVPADGGSPQDGSGPAPVIRALTAPDAIAWRSGAALSTGPDGARTLRVAFLEVDAAGQSDLAAASRALQPDAVLAGLVPSVPNPAPGAAVDVAVEVRNEGDASIAALQVQLLDNGQVVGTLVAPDLAAGASATLTFPWAVPLGDAAHTLRAVADPGALVAELSEANNALETVTVLPALGIAVLAETSPAGTLKVEATLTNLGVRPAPAGQAVLALEDTGEVLATFGHGSLAPGASVVLDVTPDPALLPFDGAFVTLAIDPDEDFEAVDNLAHAYVAALPDLAVSDLVVSGTSAGTVPASLTVANLGARAAAATVLQVWNPPPGEPGEAVIATVPLPALAAGAEVTVDASFPGQAGEAAYVFRAGTIAERDANPVDNSLGRTLTFRGRPDGDVAVASLAYEPGGVRVTVFNRGDADLPFVAFNLYNGPPLKVPLYGLKYRTEVETLVGRGSVANVPAHGWASTLLPTASLKLAQLPVGGNLTVWLDPDEVADDADRGNQVGLTPAFSARSTSHPDPRTPGVASTVAFAFGVKPGFTLGGVSYVLDQAPGTIPDTISEGANLTKAFPGVANGAWWLHARGLVSGTWSRPVHVPVLVNAVDNLAPLTRLLYDGVWVARGNVVHLGDNVPLRFDARDAADGATGVSGVLRTEASVDGGAFAPVTGPLRLAGAGPHTVAWRSVDVAGNVEATRTQAFEVEVDTHAPATTLGGALERDGNLFVAPGAPLTFPAVEPVPYFARFGSGLAHTLVRVDGGAWQTDPRSVSFAGPDVAHTLEFFSVDRDGNTEPTQLLVVTVDSTGPALDVTSHQDDDLVIGTVSFLLDVRDAGVGAARASLYREGQVVATVEGADGVFNFTVDTGFWTFGNNHLVFRAEDRLGNAAEVPLTVYALTRNVAVWKDPPENLDRLLPAAVRALVPA